VASCKKIPNNYSLMFRLTEKYFSIFLFMDLKLKSGKRRTFAIISHPDAGKTTLTEKIAPFWRSYSDSRCSKKQQNTETTTSDFMEIEKQRVFQFPLP